MFVGEALEARRPSSRVLPSIHEDRGCRRGGARILSGRIRRRSAPSLAQAFDLGTTGPGGWVILDEPELHLGPEPDILVPDLAGYREERFPGGPNDDDAGEGRAPGGACSTGTHENVREQPVPLSSRRRTCRMDAGRAPPRRHLDIGGHQGSFRTTACSTRASLPPGERPSAPESGRAGEL